MAQPLYRKFYSDFYDPEISGRVMLNFQWWADIARHAAPITIHRVGRRPER